MRIQNPKRKALKRMRRDIGIRSMANRSMALEDTDEDGGKRIID